MATLGKYHKDPDYFEPLEERKRMNFLITGIAQEWGLSYEIIGLWQLE